MFILIVAENVRKNMPSGVRQTPRNVCQGLMNKMYVARFQNAIPITIATKLSKSCWHGYSRKL